MTTDPVKTEPTEPHGKKLPAYVLVTPAWNEAEFIEETLRSMVAQTVLPLKWVIVSDGSTDGTDEIVQKYAAGHDWIELVRMPERKERHFAGKVHAFNAGADRVKELPYDIIGNLDADISFEEDLMEFILARFAENGDLGVAGTAFIEGGAVLYDYDIVSVEDVSGQCQLFRRQCFEEIDGYTPSRIGGIDSMAVYAAAMKGWTTRTFTERAFIHHRQVGTAQNTIFSTRFKNGQKDYCLGGHPLWEVFRCLYQMKNRPYVLGGLLLYSGYVWAYLKGAERPMSAELVRFRRKEQLQRLKTIIRRALMPAENAPGPAVHGE